jgi:hypothetical protein
MSSVLKNVNERLVFTSSKPYSVMELLEMLRQERTEVSYNSLTRVINPASIILL